MFLGMKCTGTPGRYRGACSTCTTTVPLLSLSPSPVAAWSLPLSSRWSWKFAWSIPSPSRPTTSRRGQLQILKSTLDVGDGDGWLIVDDLVDTGKTARAIRDMMPAAHFATVYAKPEGRPLVDTFVTEVSQDTWIYFPWDLAPHANQPLIKSR